MKSFRSRRIQLALAVLMLSSLACNLFNRAAEPPVDAAPIPVTTQAVEELEQNIQEAATAAVEDRQVTLVVDEAQVTSLVAFELENQSDPQITEPQVFLQDGQVQFLANVQQSGLSLPLEIILTVTANAQGKPEYEVVSANVGPFPLPDNLLNQFESQLDSVLAANLSSDEIFIEDIDIADGKMTITGHKL